MTSPKFRDQRRTIYLLKKRFGFSMSLLRTFNDQTDLNSGIETSQVQEVKMKGVLLPSKNQRQAQYRQDYITSACPFTYGALFDTKQAHLLVSRRDIPAEFPVDLNMYAKIGPNRYEVKELVEYAGYEQLGLELLRMDGAPPLNQFSSEVTDDLNLGQSNSDAYVPGF